MLQHEIDFFQNYILPMLKIAKTLANDVQTFLNQAKASQQKLTTCNQQLANSQAQLATCDKKDAKKYQKCTETMNDYIYKVE